MFCRYRTSGSNVSVGKTEFFEANAPSRSTHIQNEAEGPEVYNILYFFLSFTSKIFYFMFIK